MISIFTPTLMQTFDQDIRDFVFANMRTTPTTLPDLQKKSPTELLAIYGNWRRRYVDPVPRQVHLSAAFRASPHLEHPNYKAEIPVLVKKLANGGDIRPHLSERVRDAYKVRNPAKPKKLSDRRDMDLLLNDWGVHHLHLSSQPGKKGFFARTEMVLMAAFTQTDAYLIDIKDHDSWADDEIVRIMVREWPDAGLIHRFHDGTNDSRITKEERQALRDIGTNATVNIDGEMYFGSGFSSSGISSDALMEGMRVHRRLEWFANVIETDPAFIPRTLLQQGITPKLPADLHFDVAFGTWGVVERKTGTFLRLPD